MNKYFHICGSGAFLRLLFLFSRLLALPAPCPYRAVQPPAKPVVMTRQKNKKFFIYHVTKIGVSGFYIVKAIKKGRLSENIVLFKVHKSVYLRETTGILIDLKDQKCQKQRQK